MAYRCCTVRGARLGAAVEGIGLGGYDFGNVDAVDVAEIQDSSQQVLGSEGYAGAWGDEVGGVYWGSAGAESYDGVEVGMWGL